jgi:multimeric flavodoxin WrbA
MPKKTVILDGTRPDDDQHSDSILTTLINVLHEHENSRTQVFRLRDIKIKPCIGCFNCWVRTPGRCIHTDDAGSDILQAILNSDTLILFTPVVFGGYSSELKKMVDRFLPLWLPFFQEAHGETHHPFRYQTLSRFIGIGVHPDPSKKIHECFKMVIGRNAENLYSSSYTANVVGAADSKEKLSSQFQALLTGKDDLPSPDDLISLMNNMTSEAPTVSVGNRKILLLVGSPKPKKNSTSAVLGYSLLKKFERLNWDTELLTLNSTLLDEQEGRNKLFSAIRGADIISLSFPLYIDTLPFSVIRTLEIIARNKDKIIRPYCSKYFLALVNNGFLEVYQNAPALAVCRNFAIECDMIWAGGLAMGAGEAFVSGRSLTGFTGFNGFKRLPLYHVVRALNMTATALAEGRPVPEKARRLIAKKPVPFISFGLLRQLYIKLGKRAWEKEAALNGLTEKDMLDRPYAQ